jgi:tyrosyl-tRNA synthetase
LKVEEAKRLVKGGAITLNNRLVPQLNHTMSVTNDFIDQVVCIVRTGKKKHVVVRLV